MVYAPYRKRKTTKVRIKIAPKKQTIKTRLVKGWSRVVNVAKAKAEKAAQGADAERIASQLYYIWSGAYKPPTLKKAGAEISGAIKAKKGGKVVIGRRAGLFSLFKSVTPNDPELRALREDMEKKKKEMREGEEIKEDTLVKEMAEFFDIKKTTAKKIINAVMQKNPQTTLKDIKAYIEVAKETLDELHSEALSFTINPALLIVPESLIIIRATLRRILK